MNGNRENVLEGIFAVAKPAHISSADVLQKLQSTFASSDLFAPLLHTQPRRPSKGDDNVFKMGHGGTLDPLAAGVLIVGIGRGTKHLNKYLACSKTYETVVLFGASTDTYDCTGVVNGRGPFEHVTRQLVEQNLVRFRGKIMQVPPIYSALKVNGIKACEYARNGKELPRELEGREMTVDDCTLLEWYDGGQNNLNVLGGEELAHAPAARIRLTVGSGFYVRSFAHDLGIACETKSHMVALLRTRQSDYAIAEAAQDSDFVSAITYADLDAEEEVWALKIRPQLEAWVAANPIVTGHVNGRMGGIKQKLAKDNMPRQRFRGGWIAETKKERIEQQGGKYKGKWGLKKQEAVTGAKNESASPI
ncbi:tRNA pseudouridine synthase B [Ampelomyces quisqualis]|uniref:tRNA pseudouridine(55) synthase n=1 Tax=Ampelomyces quisqualis TaxID=50730 RepID=A0A6A5QDN3_AMPQU|nr:tRNA pseudouridine synthase B [Ampelomyces quisqualis]